jgi:sugar phosphate isomerase/epimerase
MKRTGGPKIGISLNAYSFNDALRGGRLTLDELLEFCAKLNFDAVDLTGYYFQGYPEDPPSRQISEIKRRAFVLGLEISGTGVRNDFTLPVGPDLDGEMDLVKRWLKVSARLGAPNLRVFAGRRVESDSEWQAARDRVARSLTGCVPEAEAQGVMMAIQNHADFILNAGQLRSILDMVKSPWVGVNLDVGSFPTSDPYSDIADVAPYAVSWQIKQEVSRNDRKEPVDLKKVATILRESQYRGYILLETLGEGDPKQKVPRFLEQIREALAG